jgi:hypothetical protein
MLYPHFLIEKVVVPKTAWQEFLELFQKCSNNIVGKNTFTKELKGLGLWHFKSNDVRKYKFHYDDVKRCLIPFLNLYDEELIIEKQVIANQVFENIPEKNDDEQTPENNLFLLMDSLAEEVELKKSPSISKKMKKT